MGETSIGCAFAEDPEGYLEQALMGAMGCGRAGGADMWPIPLGRWLRDDAGVPMREAKTHLSRLATYANETGETIRVVRNGMPWFEIRPLAYTGRGALASRCR